MTCFKLCFSDEVNVDYSKVMRTTAVEGLRVEDLVKKYFEAAEKVPYTHKHTHTHTVLLVHHPTR